MDYNEKRYIENPYLNYDIFELKDISKYLNILEDHLSVLISKQLQCYPPSTDQILLSDGTSEEDYTIYTGPGGNLWVFWRNYLYNKSQSKDIKKPFKYFKQSYEKLYEKIKENEDQIKGNFDKTPASFFMGPVGIHTMGCIYAKESNDLDLFNQHLKEVLRFEQNCYSHYSEDELLYGNAGYLYALLLIKTECEKTFSMNIDSKIYNLCIELYKIGLNAQSHYKLNTLIFPFPRKGSIKYSPSLYLGGAHGAFGVLYLMMKTIELIPSHFSGESNMIDDIRDSVDELLSLQFPSGNFPCEIGDKKDELTHFCHGATGAVYTFIQAFKLFSDKKYLKSVIAAGDHIWARGIIKKGNGVCHGISGSSYALYHIYSVTKEELWKKRSICMALATKDEKIQEICEKHFDPQRLNVGIPDAPFSLMEGQGGNISLICDILSENVKFPGFEI